MTILKTRTIESLIKDDLNSKIVLLSGPRQVGKTTLSKSLYEDFDYFNYDLAEDRLSLKEKSWDRKKTLIIFDELHKMRSWKRWLKGVYDTEGIPPKMLVTGSAKLDVYRKVGDSLAGRYFQYRLHPLDIKEASKYWDGAAEDVFDRLWHCSGYPEPFLKGSEQFYRRWQRSHLDIILRQDLLDLESVRDIHAIETLVSLLKRRVGSSVSYSNLARDLERDPTTIKRWLVMLENLYVIFRVTPYHKKITRSLLKEPKFYFYDMGQVQGDEGVKLENMVACALQKELQLIEDSSGYTTQLHYLRTKDNRELDFLCVIDDKPIIMLEVKWADADISKHFSYFSKFFNDIPGIQLVRNLKREKTFPDKIELRSVVTWLKRLDLNEF